jgi:outer membrane lipoprotein-sorting protein
MARLLAAALAALVVLAAPARAEDGPAPAAWPEEDRTLIAEVEAYLEGLTTMRARFTQLNDDGGLDHGILWLWRPGLARVEYAPPTEVLLVATGTLLVYFDAELDQVSHMPANSGPFRFLLAAEVDLGGEAQVRAIERGRGLVRLTLVDAEDPGAGAVTLVFDESPLRLRQWEVLDAQGYLTIVTLSDQVLGETFDRDWFYFPPSARKRDFRLGDHH